MQSATPPNTPVSMELLINGADLKEPLKSFSPLVARLLCLFTISLGRRAARLSRPPLSLPSEA